MHANSIATEHEIATWQKRNWRTSKDAKHVIQLLLSLQASDTQEHRDLQSILAQNLPAFFTPSHADTFFAMLEQEQLSDSKLRAAIVDFCARWPSEHEASLEHLLADVAVRQESNTLLPSKIPLKQWIEVRLHNDMDLIPAHSGSILENDTGSWLICLRSSKESTRRPTLKMEVLARYRELDNLAKTLLQSMR